MNVFLVLALSVAYANAASLGSAIRPAFATGRIINGYEAERGEAPFIVSLKTTSHFCGGSIIAPNWVVTAGHCLIYNKFSVIAGLHTRSNQKGAQVREVPSSAYYIVHEKYDGSVGPNDIGLIYIKDAFDLDSLGRANIAPVDKISLPTGTYSQTGAGKLYGWGRTGTFGSLPDTLQTLDADIIGYNQCKNALPSNAPIDPVNICSYTAGTTDGACNGDSGGPLVRYTPTGPELVGIVSWGYTPCAASMYPSVYTMTSAFSNWISEKQASFTVPADLTDI